MLANRNQVTISQAKFGCRHRGQDAFEMFQLWVCWDQVADCLRWKEVLEKGYFQALRFAVKKTPSRVPPPKALRKVLEESWPV